MNKKVYQKPAIDVQEIALESAILAASGEINAAFDDENSIDYGQVDSRKNHGFSIWDED